ncbi:hypothetical protein TURU_015702 [Turdus rufiventris]|nr:hypothetical protein TURU_015702 [Turdus rufiventris]
MPSRTEPSRWRHRGSVEPGLKFEEMNAELEENKELAGNRLNELEELHQDLEEVTTQNEKLKAIMVYGKSMAANEQGLVFLSKMFRVTVGGAGGSFAQLGCRTPHSSVCVCVLQARLTCPCCNMRKKDAVLTKCFHVFCFECVKTRYDTRQRKCPKCNAAFGANDFHRIYIG